MRTERDKLTKHKIVPFPLSQFDEFLDELKQLCREDRLKDFVCIYSNSRKEDEEIEVFDYWFGETSTVMCLGLIEVIKDRILEYMRAA